MNVVEAASPAAGKAMANNPEAQDIRALKKGAPSILPIISSNLVS